MKSASIPVRNNVFTNCIIHIADRVMHQSFVTTAPPHTGKGGDNDFSVSVPCYEPHPRGQTGGQNFALCPTLRNRKSPWGKNPNVKTPHARIQIFS